MIRLANKYTPLISKFQLGVFLEIFEMDMEIKFVGNSYKHDDAKRIMSIMFPELVIPEHCVLPLFRGIGPFSDCCVKVDGTTVTINVSRLRYAHETYADYCQWLGNHFNVDPWLFAVTKDGRAAPALALGRAVGRLQPVTKYSGDNTPRFAHARLASLYSNWRGPSFSW